MARSYNNEYAYHVGDENGVIKLWKVPFGTTKRIHIASKKNGIVIKTSSYNPNDDIEAMNDFYEFEEV